MLTKRKLITLVATTLALLIVVITLVVLIVSLSKAPVHTYPAKEKTVTPTLDLDGYLFVDSKEIKTSKLESIVYEVYTGDTVTQGQVIANSYPNSTSEQLVKLADVNKQIHIYNMALSFSDITLNETDNKISNVNAILASLSSNSGSKLYSYYTDYLSALTLHRSSIYSDMTDLEYELIALKELKKMTVSEMGSSVQITSPYDGIFSSTCSSYANDFNAQNISKYSFDNKDYFSNLVPSDTSSSIGCVVTGSKAYFATIFDKEDTQLTINSPYTLVIDDISVQSTLYSLEESNDMSQIKAVFVFDYTFAVDFENPKAFALLEKDSITGLSIAKEDLYDIKGKTCVYILDKENKARLREVEVIYESGTSLIVKKNTASKVYPTLKEGEIIISGVYRIYDGKIIKWVIYLLEKEY